MKKQIKVIAILSAAVIFISAKAHAQIDKINCDLNGNISVAGSFDMIDNQQALIAVVKPNKEFEDTSDYVYLEKLNVSSKGIFNTNFYFEGESGIYSVFVIKGDEIFKDRFIYLSQQDIKNYTDKINGAKSGEELQIIFDADYHKLYKICDIGIDDTEQNSKKFYNTLLEIKNEKEFINLTDIKNAITESILISDFYTSDITESQKILDKITKSFSDESVSYLKLYNKNESLKQNVAKKMKEVNVSRIKNFENLFIETVPYVNIQNAHNAYEKKEIVNELKDDITFKEKEYFFGLNETKQVNIISSINEKYSSFKEFLTLISNKCSEYRANENKNNQQNTNTGGTGSTTNRNNSTTVVGWDSQPQTEINYEFDDMNNYEWAENAVDFLYKKGVINGKGNNKFAPEDNIKREEFVVMAVNLFYASEQCKSVDFADVKKNMWYSDKIAVAYQKKIINGISDEMFGIGTEITRQDASVVCSRIAADLYELAQESEETSNSDELHGGIFEYTDIDTDPFNDFEDVSDYAKEPVKRMFKAGIINGMPNGNFMPENNMSRAEAAVMLYRLYKLKEVL
mgnify:FL=1